MKPVQFSASSLTLSAPSPSEEPVRKRRKRSYPVADDSPNVTVSFDLFLQHTEGEQDWAGIRLRGQKSSRRGYYFIVRGDGRLEILLVKPDFHEQSIGHYILPHTRPTLRCTVSIDGTQIWAELNGTEIMRAATDPYADVGGVFIEICRATATFSNLQVEAIQSEFTGLPSTAVMPSDLADALTRHTLALFIGADLPREVTGLPSRADLARDLAQRKGRARSRVDSSLSLAEVAQRVAWGGNRWDFTAFIRDQLDTSGKSPQPFHRRIIELVQEHQIKTLITTAYDNLLELAFQEAGLPLNRVVRGSDVSFITPDCPTLIKLYGDAQQPDTLVVIEDDHYGLWRDRDKEDLLHEVRMVLRRQTVLFLGYNLADPDFNLLWREVLDRAGRFARTAYAVWPGLPEGEVRMWRDRGIEILDEDPLGVLSEFEALLALAGRPEPEVGIPKSESSVGGKVMDYERGLDALKQLAEGADWHQDFTVQEAPLLENLRDERRYGPSEQTRRDRTRLVDRLNALALDHLGISFNDLCMGKPPPPRLSSPEAERNRDWDWDTEVIRQLLTEAFSDGELTTLCFDHFRPVYENLSSGMSKGQKIQLLLDHCTREEQVEVLLELVKDRRSAKYDRFSPRLRLEKSVTPSEPSPPQPPSQPPQHPRRERTCVRFKLQLARLVGLEFEVRALETPMGEPRATTHLPYDQDALIAILKALPAASLEAAKLTPPQAEILRDLDLLTNPSLVSDLHAQVGRALYRSLFPGDVGAAFQVAWSQVRAQRGLVSLQLRFDEDAVALARYPWELMYDRRHLLPGGAVELTRYVSYAEAPTLLSIEPPLRLLYVESRPTSLDSLPVGEERKAVRAALEELETEGLLLLETLTSPTYDALIDRVESAQDHVLHFDGHGTVARRCPACGGMNYPHHTSCQRPGCDRTLTDVPPLGYLAFEKAGSRQVDWVDSKALEHLLYPSMVRVAVLSACRSGEVRGETLFGGLGPALIQAGVPAVVTMQAPISAPAAARFVQGFYGALTRFDSLPAAMTSGRRRLFRGREWFIPALYLRSRDDEGQLFKSSSL